MGIGRAPHVTVRYGVIVAGAGPTGLTLANLLALDGVRVLVLERNSATVQEPRAVSIDDEALRTMQAAGLVDDVLPTIVPGYGYRYLNPAGRVFASVAPAAAPYGYPRRSAFRQPVLERQLRHGLARFPNADVWFGHILESFGQDERGVTVRVRGPDGRLLEVGGEYLVGCDGAASTVRQTLGVPLEGSSFSERWLIVDLESSEASSPHTLVFCDPKRPGIALPGPDRTRRFEFKLHPHERDDDMLSPGVIGELLRTHGADPRSLTRRTVVYRFHARVAARWADGRVLLGGDAAHLSPPFAGQGMNSGIRDAHNLAWKLAAILRGQLGPGMLETYEAERRPHVSEMIQLALRMGRVMAPPNSLAAWGLAHGVRLLTLYPPARDYVMEMRWRPAPRFTAGFLIPDDRHAQESLVGRLFPQPLVAAADGRTVLLDTVLGNRFTLLAYTARPDAVFTEASQEIWDRLGAVRLAVLPRDHTWQQTARVQATVDSSGNVGAAFARYPDHVLLLRPDHYVAACIPIHNWAQTAEAVQTLIARISRA
ncbi:MAG TPA: bifunctional 3-(3-hydroxy-phenyl)propionate/3-hydroxycinnamic acid hydroxylase [bacterium]|nr:bifunctional 3-(3-hydroxy-phenyl)propionate/3-hydroxycinnamic acid hydroxylase [bacterium]